MSAKPRKHERGCCCVYCVHARLEKAKGGKMSAKPRFKPVTAWATNYAPNKISIRSFKVKGATKICLTDARDLTAEKAVEILCQWEYACMADVGGPNEDKKLAVQCVEEMAAKCGMIATIDCNGKVKVRRAKR